jgi:hypothetical protein
VPNCTKMGQTLFDLLNGRNIRLYPAADMSEQALHTVAIENPWGFKLAKEKTTNNIDSIVALAMACVAAIERGKVVLRPEELNGRVREIEVDMNFDPRRLNGHW